eukprot:scaffold42315_cov34-Prasinocladus_malaysianus.AAC.1
MSKKAEIVLLAARWHEYIVTEYLQPSATASTLTVYEGRVLFFELRIQSAIRLAVFEAALVSSDIYGDQQPQMNASVTAVAHFDPADGPDIHGN